MIEFKFQLWDSKTSGEKDYSGNWRVKPHKNRDGSVWYKFDCMACHKKINYDLVPMLEPNIKIEHKGRGSYIHNNERCKLLYIFQNI